MTCLSFLLSPLSISLYLSLSSLIFYPTQILPSERPPRPLASRMTFPTFLLQQFSLPSGGGRKRFPGEFLSKWRVDFCFLFLKGHPCVLASSAVCCRRRILFCCCYFSIFCTGGDRYPIKLSIFFFDFDQKKSKAGARRCLIVSCIIHHSSPTTTTARL